MQTALDLYPPSVTGAPPELTQPSPAYQRSVVMVLAGLIGFLVLYLLLVAGCGWLLWTALSYDVGEVNRLTIFLKIGTIAMAGMLFLFVVKGLFKRQRVEDPLHLEIREQEYPELFQFIRRLCAEAGAPFPYRVFLSPEVNAAVFYNTSLLNLVFPVKKNLLIGLGLVNCLDLAEFKAVLAHEYGHFSQNSMRLGQYVYVANRIILDMVFGRDRWDDLLAQGRQLDLRVAIFAWLLTGIVWAVRQALQGAFHLLNLSRSRLSFQEEFHADLVAVSVTGSDTLIHALRKIGFGGECFGQAMMDLKAASDHQLYTRDLFYHQLAASTHLRRVANKPELGVPPPLPAELSEKSQVFAEDEEGIPEMYASHPPNHEREKNAKRHYLRSPQDPRSAWLLFREPEKLRQQMTERVYQVAFDKAPEAPCAEPEQVQTFINEEHEETTYDPRYHGLYDGRYVEVGTDPAEVTALAQAVAQHPWPTERVLATTRRLYGGELKERLDQNQKRLGERALLQGLEEGELKFKGKTFTFREQERRSSDIKGLLEQVDGELEADRKYLRDLDINVFQAHYQMAGHLADSSHEELFWRYQFHVGVQEVLRTGVVQKLTLEHLLQVLSQQGSRLEEEDFEEALRLLGNIRSELEGAVQRAAGLTLPPLKNMQPGTPLSAFLLSEPVVAALPADTKNLNGEWVGQLYKQLSAVEEKSRRVHFKSLGTILALQERIAGAWQQRATGGTGTLFPEAPAPVS